MRLLGRGAGRVSCAECELESRQSQGECEFESVRQSEFESGRSLLGRVFIVCAQSVANRLTLKLSRPVLFQEVDIEQARLFQVRESYEAGFLRDPRGQALAKVGAS